MYLRALRSCENLSFVNDCIELEADLKSLERFRFIRPNYIKI